MGQIPLSSITQCLALKENKNIFFIYLRISFLFYHDKDPYISQ
jgi:hypothetical protein